jgi:hypothetical protein
MRDGTFDGLGNPIPARMSEAMAGEREPLLGGPILLCTVPGCLRDVRADGLCIADLEVREISRPYGLDPTQLRLAEDCNCLVHRKTGAVVQPCADCAPAALVKPLR